MLFDVNSKAQLCRLLAVAPGEVDHVLGRLSRFYRSKPLPKRSGGFRTLLVPQGKLAILQSKIKSHILDQFTWLNCVHGGIKRRSVKSNALPHVSKSVVFSVDVKDFFPHVTPDRVLRIFCGLGFGDEPARILTKATTWDHQLPQGATTSTHLANLSLVGVDWRLVQLSRQHGFSYTRYVDDLTISGQWRLLKFRRLIQRIIESEGFVVKPEKTVTMHEGMRQSVTKLVVNSKINMPREWRRVVRRQVVRGPGQHELGTSRDASIRGRVNWLHYLNPVLGEKLLDRMIDLEVQSAHGEPTAKLAPVCGGSNATT